MNMVKIRDLRENDLFDLALLYEHYTNNTVYTYYTGQVNAEYMRRILYGMGHVCRVAVENGHAIGYVHISPHGTVRRHDCEMAVYLLPAYVGCGIGRRLAEAGEQAAREMGYRHMHAAVCTENQRSMALFLHMGYQRTKVQQDAAQKFGRMLHTQFFEKPLKKIRSLF